MAYYLPDDKEVCIGEDIMQMDAPDSINKFSSLSDDEICIMIRDGSNEAFNELAIRYMSLLRAKSSLYIRYGLEAEDLFQEALLALLNAAKNYKADEGASFKTFVGICVERSLLSICKAAFRKKRIPPGMVLSLEMLNDSPGSDVTLSSDLNINPEQIVINQEQLEIKKNFIKRSLTSLEYNVLLLYIGGASYEDIAKRFFISFKSVDNALQRCRRKLKKDIYIEN